MTICEECNEKRAEKICSSCDAYLCKECFEAHKCEGFIEDNNE
jgi:hypothetical protein